MLQSVKTKLLVPLVILVSISLVTLVTLSYRQMRDAILDQEQVGYRNIESIVRNDLEAVFTSARMGLTGIIHMPDIQQAFAERNREELLRLTAPIFEQAKRDGIEQIQFHLPPATSFLRLHQPKKFGDDLSSFRATVMQSNKEKKLVAGLEEGRGGYGFRVVAPVFYQGEHIGSAEYGMGFNPKLLARWKEQCGGEFFMYPYASSGVAWQKVDKNKPLAGTSERDPLAVDAGEVKKAMSGKGVHSVYLNNAAAAVLIIPVYDYSGVPISM
ncbi:cache domain-containing protein [Desulforamulus profundi]|uniref:cache domain-containing protein n=1 Tax=Desulforamulus profundi TaxID=1383067 RepID=UPI001EE5E611|nr:cache domain-containing protein [Desulforamulus profundi]